MDETTFLLAKDVVPLRGPRPPSARRLPRHGPPAPYTVTRRRFTQAALAAATGLGLASLGVFPPAREAFADGYDMIQGCNGIRYDDCTGCGPSTKCRSVGCCNASNWHRNDGVDWILRTNQCKGTGGVSGKDGWWWDLPASAPCGCSPLRHRWKCHDGWKLNAPGGEDNVKTICDTKVCF
jgi:hypothetical protein